MKITFRLPSKVPYAYAEVTFDDATDPVPDMERLAQQYAEALTTFKDAEKAALAAGPTARPKKDKASEVDELLGLGVPVNPSDAAVDAAAALIKDGLGATEIDGDDPKAPWNRGETPKAEPQASSSDDDWDF